MFTEPESVFLPRCLNDRRLDVVARKRGASFPRAEQELQKKDDITRHSAEVLGSMSSHADWGKVDATTPEKFERQADVDDGPLPGNWDNTVILGVPGPKRGVYPRLGPDVLDWFEDTGKG